MTKPRKITEEDRRRVREVQRHAHTHEDWPERDEPERKEPDSTAGDQQH